MIKEYNLEESINIHPAVSDIYEKYQESYFLVLSSRVEEFDLVLTEAMSCGRPCVSFDRPSDPSKIITDNVDGLLANSGNINDLADKINWMIEHNNERVLMGEKPGYLQNDL